MEASHPYEEPSLTVILVLTGFLLLLNGVNMVLDNMLYCGLVGQVFVGVLFGTPGAKFLTDEVESTVSNLGYLGLILLVYEGGLSTLLSDLVASFTLSLLVALTGILFPIALSFLLVPLGASPLQCFSVGASLSATSLGTAFATLSSSGLLNTDVGTVLTSAAMLDDVIGLVMLQVVTALSTGQGSPSDFGKTIGRALGASVGLVLVVVIFCRFILRPLYKPVDTWLKSPKRSQRFKSTFAGAYFLLVVHTALLLILVVAGSYAGTSVLLAAFIAGTVVRWWGDVVPNNGVGVEHVKPQETPTVHELPQTGLEIYERFYRPTAERLLRPFFFASIGFSIPVTQMFHATTVWKGLVFALLMFLAKVATGLWLVPRSLNLSSRSCFSFSLKWCWKWKTEPKLERGPTPQDISPGSAEVKPPEREMTDSSHLRPTIGNEEIKPSKTEPTNYSLPDPTAEAKPLETGIAKSSLAGLASTSCVVPQSNPTQGVLTTTNTTQPSIPPESTHTPLETIALRKCDADLSPSPPILQSKTQTQTPIQALPGSSPSPDPVTQISSSLSPEKRVLRTYSPALLGLAMAARGEIGFLIASVAESHGIFNSSSSSSTPVPGERNELYPVVVWAIVLCTVVGPVGVGGLVRRIKRLEVQERPA